jgi:hypothetical protein
MGGVRMSTTYVDASPKETPLDRSAYENDGARMIFAISRLADAGRLNVYQGTVSDKTKTKRRKANKAARAARRA